MCVASLGVAAVLAAAPSPAAAQQDPTCSRETAEQVAGPTNPFNPTCRTPILQVLCGPYAGPGSNAMVVTFTAADLLGRAGLGDLRPPRRRVAGGAARRRLARRAARRPRATAASARSAPCSRGSDPRCLPSGGTRGRTWSWDGSRFVAARVEADRGAHHPRGAGACQLKDDGTPTGSFAYCWTGNATADSHSTAPSTPRSRSRNRWASAGPTSGRTRPHRRALALQGAPHQRHLLGASDREGHALHRERQGDSHRRNGLSR